MPYWLASPGPAKHQKKTSCIFTSHRTSCSVHLGGTLLLSCVDVMSKLLFSFGTCFPALLLLMISRYWRKNGQRGSLDFKQCSLLRLCNLLPVGLPSNRSHCQYHIRACHRLVYLPQIDLSFSLLDWPVRFQPRQFPVQVKCQ